MLSLQKCDPKWYLRLCATFFVCLVYAAFRYAALDQNDAMGQTIGTILKVFGGLCALAFGSMMAGIGLVEMIVNPKWPFTCKVVYFEGFRKGREYLLGALLATVVTLVLEGMLWVVIFLGRE